MSSLVLYFFKIARYSGLITAFIFVSVFPAKAQLTDDYARDLYELTVFSQIYSDMCNEREVFLGSHFQNNLNFSRKELVISLMDQDLDLTQIKARKRVGQIRQALAMEVAKIHEESGCNGPAISLAKRHYSYLAHTPTGQVIQKVLRLQSNGLDLSNLSK